MIEGEKKNSAIKNGLIALSKLKGSSKFAGEKKKSTKKLITIHPDDDDDIASQQYNDHTKVVELTNADFQIKFLLNGFFENIGEEDKPSDAVDDKLKKLFDQTINEDDSKTWKKSSTKYNSRNALAQGSNSNNNNNNVNFTGAAQFVGRNNARFKSTKVLNKMSFGNVQLNNKLTDEQEGGLSGKKTSSSTRNLPNCPKFPMHSHKKRSRFGTESTHNLHSIIPEFTRKTEPLHKKNHSSKNNTHTNNTITVTSSINNDKDNVSSLYLSNSGTLNFTFKKESKNSNILNTYSNNNSNNNNHANTLSNFASSYFDTENSNKTAYHHEQTGHTFNSSKKVKSSSFSQFNSNASDTPTKKRFKTTKFKKNLSDVSFKGYMTSFNQPEPISNNILEIPLPVIQKAKTNKHRERRFAHDHLFVEISHFPLKAKTHEYSKRTTKRMHSSSLP